MALASLQKNHIKEGKFIHPKTLIDQFAKTKTPSGGCFLNIDSNALFSDLDIIIIQD